MDLIAFAVIILRCVRFYTNGLPKELSMASDMPNLNWKQAVYSSGNLCTLFK